MVLRTRQELRCEPSRRQGARQSGETTGEDERAVVGIHCGRGHRPWQLDCYLPQRARAWVGGQCPREAP